MGKFFLYNFTQKFSFILTGVFQLILTDRSLMPGDVVRRLNSERDSQCGFVENILVKCHLKILGTEQWIYNVDVADVASMQVC